MIWLTFAQKEYAGDWTANYIRTNKIKTVLANGDFGWAWIHPDRLDRIYLSVEGFYALLGFDDPERQRADTLRDAYRFVTHEVMHLVQYKSDAFRLMAGMRPDICAAANMLTEFLTWFYTENRNPDAYVSAETKHAVAAQSRYMTLACDPWEYDNVSAKDPSLPSYVHSTPWFNNELSSYAQHAFTSNFHEIAMTKPLVQAGKEDMLKVARSLLACRDPGTVGVTDDALWTVFDALRNVANGNSKYLKITDDPNKYYYSVRKDSFEHFHNVIIANWDAEFAAQNGD
jgi:hypothetical protein